MAEVMTTTISGMTAGDIRSNQLERARSKLLLALLPAGRNLKVELGCRFGLWAKNKLQQLRIRIEEQAFERADRRRRAPRGPAALMKAKRAKALARDGAYRRAVMSLTSSVAELGREDQERWAKELLPASGRPTMAHFKSARSRSDASDEAASDPTMLGKLLQGVRFSALSAPGPSGFRPEHLREVMSVKAPSVTTKLLQAIAFFQTMAFARTLPEECRWILGSRLIYLQKKKGLGPRPVRIVEVWRRMLAKKLVFSTEKKLQQVCLQARQFGVAIPGGADALIHFRKTCEEAAKMEG
jgi:hypothetical protein